jgi:Matrixin
MPVSAFTPATVVVVWLGCISQAGARTPETRHSNWISTDAACARYDDLRKPVLGDIGVKIDATGPWADGFRRALSLWNTVLAANFHEETDLDACAIRIVNASPGLLSNSMVARSQLTEWDDFRGKIAVRPDASNTMSSGEIYGTAVHELGHMLGLKHNASSQSVMYFFNVDGTEVLDKTDILDLRVRHKLRVALASAGPKSLDFVLSADAH